MSHALGDAPIRIRDAGKIGQVVAAALGGALGGALTIGMVLLSAGEWKGTVDDQLKNFSTSLTLLQQQVQGMDAKIDRLADRIANTK